MLLFSARQHNSSTVTPNTSASRYANISEGLYCSFSMEMIVRLETCVRSASCCCVSPAAVRSSFSFVFMRSSGCEAYFL